MCDLILFDVNTDPAVLECRPGRSRSHLSPGRCQPAQGRERVRDRQYRPDRADAGAPLRSWGRTPVFVLSSSTQAELDNPYGQSKKAAEDAVLEFNGQDRGPGLRLSPARRLRQVDRGPTTTPWSPPSATTSPVGLTSPSTTRTGKWNWSTSTTWWPLSCGISMAPRILPGSATAWAGPSGSLWANWRADPPAACHPRDADGPRPCATTS